MAMVVLILEYMGWPFVLQFSSSPLVFDSSPFSSGCLLRWGRFRWPWGKFIFCSALSLIWSISLTLRHEFDFCSALTSIGSISLSLRHDFNFCSALTSMESIALTLRHDFDFYSALTSVGSISLTLRHEIISCSGSLLWHSDSGLFENFGRR